MSNDKSFTSDSMVSFGANTVDIEYLACDPINGTHTRYTGGQFGYEQDKQMCNFSVEKAWGI